MKRREFITLLGGAAAWPLAARAQQAERMRRIGVLLQAARANDPEDAARLTAFVQGLQAVGLDRRPQRRGSSYRWGAGECRPHPQDTRPNWSRSRRTSSSPPVAQRPWRALQRATPHHADRVRTVARPGRRRLRREPGAAGRQRHRLQRSSNTA